MFGFYRIAAVVPQLKVADVQGNAEEILSCARSAASAGAELAVFPELCLTGYTCADLFHQKLLLDKAEEQLFRIAQAMKDSSMVMALGLPVRFRSRLFNCAALLQRGQVLCLTPKLHLPNQREFYEKRHFSSGIHVMDQACYQGRYFSAPFTDRADFPENHLCVGLELCEDLWVPAPPSSRMAWEGVNVILNLSASNALVSKARYRRELVTQQSARCMAVYAYASSGVHESTTDTVYGGHAMIAENGSLLAESNRFQRTSEIIYADVDVDRLNMTRISEGAFQDGDGVPAGRDCPSPVGSALTGADSLQYRTVNPLPFVPGTMQDRSEVCREIFQIQCAGLAKRLESARADRAVIGISGGLDSTLALLVTCETYRMLGRDPRKILTLTMPGFGTSVRTKGNSETLAELLGTELRTVDIRNACLQHFSDIGHDGKVLDTTYENVQARERTQILMDTANRENGLVVGTGDLSEIALGWCTYNADHMSMYSVNCGIPKTLVRHMVAWYADRNPGPLGDVLRDILDTPVSPELLPADAEGRISQKTEAILGEYELHDFYLYHFVKYGAEPEKLRFLARCAFSGHHTDAEIDRTLKIFFRRFFSQQFKRSCIPDGPKVGSIALSPRADWRMPSDASAELWLSSLEFAEENRPREGR